MPRTIKKATDDELKESYARTKSIWKTAEEFGMCGQSVHERLVKLKVKMINRKFTKAEDAIIVAAYSAAGKNSIDLKALAQVLNRPHYTNISRRARALGLTSLSRGKSEASRIASSRNMVKRIKAGEPIGYPTTKKGWYTFPDDKRYFLKSSWELAYANYLESLKISGTILEWEYEVDTFWFEKIKRGVRSYTPDFKVTLPSGDVEYHEVKGYLDSRSKTKLNRMRIYHNIKVKLIDRAVMRQLGLI